MRIIDNNRDADIWRCFGDSFVHGACVWPGDDIAGRLRAKGHSVINLGVGGDGPLLELATLREYGADLKPSTVLWFYYEGNDLSFLPSEMRFSYLPRYLDDGFSNHLAARQDELDRTWRTIIAAQEEDREKQHNEPAARSGKGLVSLLKLANIHDYLKAHFENARKHKRWADKSRRVEDVMVNFQVESGKSLPRFSAVMGNAKNHAEAIGARLYFVYLPSYERYAYSLASYHDEVIDIVNELGIGVIDFSEFFDAQADPLDYFPFRRRGHYKPETYSILADFVVQKIPAQAVKQPD